MCFNYNVCLLAGSKFAQTGMFEVTKAEDEPPANTSPPPSPSATLPSPKPTSALRVTVPSELQGVAYIEVICKKGNFTFTCLQYHIYEVLQNNL